MLTRDDLQAISELINTAVSASEGRMMDALRQETNSLRQETNSLRQETNSLRQEMNARMDKMDARMDRMEAQLAEIKEDTEITRGATNALVEWAEQVGMLVNTPFPLLHNTAIEP